MKQAGMIDLTTPRTLAEALRLLRKDWLHDYDSLAEGPAQDRVERLGIWDEEIPLLLQMVPGAKVEKPSEIAARLDRSIRSVHGYLQFFGVNGQGARGRGSVARTIGCQFSLRMEGLTLNGLRALHRALAKGDDLATSDLRAYFDGLLREAGIDLDPRDGGEG